MMRNKKKATAMTIVLILIISALCMLGSQVLAFADEAEEIAALESLFNETNTYNCASDAKNQA